MTAADAHTTPARANVYDLAWQALHGRTDPWGGCADRDQVERIGDALNAERTRADTAESTVARVEELARRYEQQATATRTTSAKTIGEQWQRDQQADLYDQAARTLRTTLTAPATPAQEQP